MSLTCPATPAGDLHIRSNQPKTVFVQETIKKQQYFRKEPFYLMADSPKLLLFTK
jgi:hypothetical protein